MQFAVLSLLALGVAGPALSEAETRVFPREPFARAHVQMMARAQRGIAPAVMADLDIWAEGTRLRATVTGDEEKAQYWIDGLAAEPLRIVKEQIAPAKNK